jgi:hypothetical protein
VKAWAAASCAVTSLGVWEYRGDDGAAEADGSRDGGVGVGLVVGLPLDADGEDDDLADRRGQLGLRHFHADQVVVAAADPGAVQEDVERPDQMARVVLGREPGTRGPWQRTGLQLVVERLSGATGAVVGCGAGSVMSR